MLYQNLRFMKGRVVGCIQNIIVLIAVFYGAPAAQADIHTWVDGRFYMDSENEFLVPSPVMYGDMVVNFYQDNLPFGSQIEIIYGLGGTELNAQGDSGPISWEKSGSVSAQPIGLYVWSANIATSLTQVEGRRRYSKLQFCVLITLPNGATYHAEHCRPPSFQLEADIPWETSPQVDKQRANWRRLNLNHTRAHEQKSRISH